jgi:PhnB protein
MARVDTYLNFRSQTASAFAFYREVFNADVVGEVVHYGDFPMDGWELSDEDKHAIMHITIAITGGHLLMGSDVLEHSGESVPSETFMHIVVNPETTSEADHIFAALSEGGRVNQSMENMPWGSYWGNLIDKFGVRWMINVDGPANG